jgi:hypothetical protein
MRTLSVLDHLELAYPPVARHDPELEGMDRYLKLKREMFAANIGRHVSR